MSFHKRYITKDLILSNINDLDRLFNADAFIMDMWSSRFCDDLRPEERIIRKDIEEKIKYNSVINYKTEPIFNDLYSMSECLISLFNRPTWWDIFKVSDKLGLIHDNAGDFEKLRELAIERIIEYYDRPNRNDKIEEILNDN